MVNEILGSGKCGCLNKDEKEKLLIAIYRTIELNSDDMKKETDPIIRKGYSDDVREFVKLREKVKNTPEC